MEWKDIEAVNSRLKSMPIRGKKYVMVKDKVLGWRALMPEGGINTEVILINDERIVIKASIYNESGIQIGSGIAEERWNSSNINKTSAVENAETSAIGRALSSMGFGAEDSYANAEEVANAIYQQEKVEVISAEDVKMLRKMLDDTDSDVEKFCEAFHIDNLKEFPKSEVERVNRMLTQKAQQMGLNKPKED